MHVPDRVDRRDRSGDRGGDDDSDDAHRNGSFGVARKTADHEVCLRPDRPATFTIMRRVPAGAVRQTLRPAVRFGLLVGPRSAPIEPSRAGGVDLPGTRAQQAFSFHPADSVPEITLDSTTGPLALDLAEGTLVTECRGPAGATGAAATELVARALSSGGHGPPLSAHVVPGDKAVIAVAGEIPQGPAVLQALAAALASGGVAGADLAILQAAPLDAARRPDVLPGALPFDPTRESGTAYLAADAAARPLYIARMLVDADVVVEVGGFGWDAALGGRSPEGELWPAFGRRGDRDALMLELARRGREALVDWRGALHDITWQLGVCASLRLVAGHGGSLHAACFGLPEEATRLARAAAAGWQPAVAEPADLAIATLSAGSRGFGAAVRAVAAAARVTLPAATVVVVGEELSSPGLVLARWRQGTPLPPLLREAASSGDPTLVADALEARLLARTLGERRLVLFSPLVEAEVEDLGFGHAAEIGVVERLANRAEQVVILHEADRMLPRR